MYTCICALFFRETEYVSHHSPFALRKVYVYIYLCTMYSGNRICKPSQPFCTEECTYMYLCTIYSGNRICKPSQPFCTEECTYMYLCTMYSGNRIYFSHNSPFTLQKVLTCICSLCIQETEYVSHNSPFLFCKNICMYLCTMYSGNRTCQPQQPPLHCKKYLHVFGH